jgi:predicted nucleotidyltransferase
MSASQLTPALQMLSSPAIAQFCARWKITELGVFGSALRPDFQHSSDIDLLVTFAPNADWSLLDHIHMQQELQEMLGRRVDLISKRALVESPNWLRRDEIINTTQIIFTASETGHEPG